MDVKAKFGKHLGEVRKSKGFSQESLAIESGLARSYLGGVERGKVNIGLTNICILAKTIGVKASVLMDFEE